MVEQFFGCFKGMWRCLSYQRVLMYDSAFAGHIVNACAVLHNMRLYHRLPAGDYYDAVDDGVNNNNVQIRDNEQGGENVRQGPRALAQRIQSQLMRERYEHLPDGNANAN